MTGTRRFHFGALVTVAHDKIMQHQVPLAMDAVTPDLLAQHPWLNDVVVPEYVRGPESLAAWFTIATARWGEWHEVTPNPICWGSHDPVEDMVALGRDPSTVIPVEAPERDS